MSTEPDCPVDPLSLFRIDNAVAVVTGASAGLGERFARVLAAAGARVVVAARRRERLEALQAELPGSLAVPVDLTRDEDAARLVATTLESFGRVDVVVNNAGTSVTTPAVDEKVDDFRRVLQVNLVAPFVITQHAAAAMLTSGGGVIINVASVFGLVGVGQIPQAGYAASKGGIVNLTRELAAQWARSGVRVNALCPGWFPSEMTSELVNDERGRTWIERRTPMGRVGGSQELDGALLFLASQASSYVTGQCLVVDGGWTTV
jgi:NAD(P)-dependent dehydrogenase (short-subunit alcohol dehydrogenase family)